MGTQVCEFVYGRMRAGRRFAHCARAIGYAAADSPEGNRMRTQAFLLMAALMAASATASAQNATNAAEVAAPAPQAAPTERRTQPRAAAASRKDAATTSTSREADVTTLVPKDSSAKPVDETRSTDRFNRQGVNCSLYPARCS